MSLVVVSRILIIADFNNYLVKHVFLVVVIASCQRPCCWCRNNTPTTSCRNFCWLVCLSETHHWHFCWPSKCVPWIGFIWDNGMWEDVWFYLRFVLMPVYILQSQSGTFGKHVLVVPWKPNVPKVMCSNILCTFIDFSSWKPQSKDGNQWLMVK